MKVLFGTPYLPVPPDFGGARRIYELIRGARRIHDVRTISLSGPGNDVRSAENYIGSTTGVRVPFTMREASNHSRRVVQIRSLASRKSAQFRLYYHPEFQRALNDATHPGGADVVQLEFSQMGIYTVPDAVKTVLDVHNIEHNLLYQMAAVGSVSRRIFNLIEHRKFRREEISAWKRAACCVATSDDDARVIEHVTGRPVPVIPNGVDLEFFTRAPEFQIEPGLVVFTGAMRYRPNAVAAGLFAEQVLPLVRREVPTAHFAIVGADPPPDVVDLGRIPSVNVTGTVEDVRPWLAKAQIVVVPLRTGGGTRLKILEAFATGRPVVSTAVGAAGIDTTHARHLLLADDPEEFARSVVELMNEKQISSRLVDNAYHLVRERYQWSTITNILNNLHEDLVKSNSKAVSGNAH